MILHFQTQFHFRFCALSLIVQKQFQCNLSWKESLFDLSLSTVNLHQFVKLPQKCYLNSRFDFSIQKKNEEEKTVLALPHAYFIALKVTLDPPEAAIAECRYVTVKIPCISHTAKLAKS